MDTNKYGNRKISKTVTCFTNETERKSFDVTIEGFVESFVTVEPGSLNIKTSLEQNLESRVRIIPKKGHHFKIVKVHAKIGKNIRFRLEEEKDAYVLIAQNIRKKSGKYVDYIYLETDSTLKPQIKVNVNADITE